MKNICKIFSIFIIAIICLLSSCNDDNLKGNSKEILAFSTDTLTFDTVFTTVGSTTEKFLVYNPTKYPINIRSITLKGENNSPFRLNVDGSISANNCFKNVEIGARDSIFIFVEVTVNPQNSDSPVLVVDSIVFETENRVQTVILEAYGQDVEIFENRIIYNDTVLSPRKPYLIRGYLALNYNKTLTIPAGCKLFFHNNANLIIYGNLVVNGSFEKPVEMRGSRLDKVRFSTPVNYNVVAGQWDGIYLLGKNAYHRLKHLYTNSGNIGIFLSNDDRTQIPSLEIENCRIHNFVYYGLVVQNGNVSVKNSEISNTGSYTVYLSGGRHIFLQSTIANYYDRNPAAPTRRDKSPAVIMQLLDKIAPMTAEFKNCIIAGTLDNEFSIADRFIDKFNGSFSNCYIQRTRIFELPQFSEIRWSAKNDTIFKSPRYDFNKGQYFDFTPDSVSPARDIADPAIATQFPLDLNGKNRLTDGKPDAGAYEWLPSGAE